MEDVFDNLKNSELYDILMRNPITGEHERAVEASKEIIRRHEQKLGWSLTYHTIEAIVEYCPDPSLVKYAGHILMDMPWIPIETYGNIIRSCSDIELKETAFDKLVACKHYFKNKIETIGYVARFCSYPALREKAVSALLLLVPHTPIDEYALLRKIACVVLADNTKLMMKVWHHYTSCGTSHCLAGWACVLNEEAQRIEREYSTAVAGCVALHSFTQYFHSDDETVLNLLTNIHIANKSKSNGGA